MFFAWWREVNAMEKEMTRELEKARQEIRLLRQENARLRKMLGMRVSEQNAEYTQAEPTPVVPNTRVGEVREASSYGGHGLSTSARLPRVDSNFSAQEKVKLFRALFRGREDVYAVFWFNERTRKKGYSPACEDPWGSRKGKPKKYLPLTDEVILSHLSGEKSSAFIHCLETETVLVFSASGWTFQGFPGKRKT